MERPQSQTHKLQNCYLFVVSGVGEAYSLHPGAGVASGTGATAEPWRGVDAAHTHVAGLHDTLHTQEESGERAVMYMFNIGIGICYLLLR